MNKLVIHIGLHKTGTTYLQTTFFPSLSACKTVRGFHSHRDLIDEYSKKQVVLTDEFFSGNTWDGTYLDDFILNMEKINTIFNEPRIILGIRKQVDWIPSIYKQYLHESGYKGMDYIFNKENTGLFKHEDVLYKPRIEKVLENFKEVFIYEQKSLITRPKDFQKGMLNFLGLPDSKTLPLKQNRRKSNIGVRTNFQVSTLIQFNKFNNFLENISPKLSLYSRVLRKLKLTPRNFCQSVLPNESADKFEISDELKKFILEYYEEDWNYALNFVSY